MSKTDKTVEIKSPHVLPYVELVRTDRELLDPLDNVLELHFPFAHFTDVATQSVANPDTKICLFFVAGKGATKCGLRPQRFYVYIDDRLYERVTYTDLGISGRECGLKRQAGGCLIHFVREVDVDIESMGNWDELSSLMGE
jgi:hypothetical protein